MNQQLSFDYERPARLNPLFFAMRPSETAAYAIEQVARRVSRDHGLSGRPYGPDRLHLSLNIVSSRRGFMKDDTLAALRAGPQVNARPFLVSLDRIVTFGTGPNWSIVMCCDEGSDALATFRGTLRQEMVKAGLWRGLSQFEPHVTMLWDRRRVPQTRVEPPISWTVDHFVLVRSVYGESRHIELGRWRLTV